MALAIRTPMKRSTHSSGGPDGWLYGCHGVFTHSRMSVNLARLHQDRVPVNAAVWRYHPTRHVFDVFARGTSNPWGVDFNDRGQAIYYRLRHPTSLARDSRSSLSAARWTANISIRISTMTSRPSPTTLTTRATFAIVLGGATNRN